MSTVTAKIKGLPDVVRQLEKLADVKGLVKAGIMEGSENYAEVVKYAPVQEFGGKIRVTDKMRGYLAANYGIHLKKTTTHITIPPRPFMRTTFEKNSEKWFEQIAKDLKAGASSELILERIGRVMVDDIIDTIMSNMPPSLSEATKIIESKSNRGPGNIDRTLYESGHMVKSIHHEVFPDVEPS